MTYKEQLLDPRWQKKRLEIFERDKFTCQICLDKKQTLHIHHKEYDKTYKTMAWEYKDYIYQTLCSDCHEALTLHIIEHKNSNEFNVFKIRENGYVFIFIYSKGKIIIKPSISPFELSEQASIKVTQFFINNLINQDA